MSSHSENLPDAPDDSLSRYALMLDKVLLGRCNSNAESWTVEWRGKTGTLSYNASDGSFTMELDGQTSKIFPDGRTEGRYEGMAQWFVSADKEIAL